MRYAKRRIQRYVKRRRHKGKILGIKVQRMSRSKWSREMIVTVKERKIIAKFNIDANGAAIPRTVRIKTGGGLIKPGKQDMEAILLHLQKRV